MEPMEIDHIMDIPDTPDRLTTSHSNPEKRERGFQVADEMNKCSSYIALSPVEKSRPSQRHPIFRRAQTDKILGHGTTHSNGAEKMDKGKAVSSKFLSRSSHHGPTSVLDLTKENGQSQHLIPAFSHRGSRDNATEDKKELKARTGNTPLLFIADSNTSINRTLAVSNTTVDRGKSIALSSDSQPKLNSEKQVSLPPHISPTPRGRGHKRLVRNGCISPHNIATMAKQSTEQGSNQANDVQENHARNLVCSNTIPTVSVEDIVAEEKGCDRVKGKQVLIHPSLHGQNAGTIHTASSLVIDSEEANGTNNDMSKSLRYSGGQGGWRTTHNEKNTEKSLNDVNRCNLRRNYDVGRFVNRQNMNRMGRRDARASQSSKDVCGSLLDHATQGNSMTIQEVDQLTPTRPSTGTLTKRPRKRVLTSGTPNEASLNSEIIFISPSGESSSSSRGPGLDPEVVDLSSEPRFANRLSEGVDGDNNISEARARQIEADEILARELQEQLYHDDGSFDGRGFDEHLAWELQQEEDLMQLHTTSTDNHQISHPRWFPRANNQAHSRSHQIPSNRRRAVPQVPFSNRMSQLRSRVITRSRAPTISSRGRRPRFPVDMDINMRLDILEALEDAVGDFMDTEVANDVIHAPHDFNENDYEMLLALDEENHRHTGASSSQINSLPQSTIQTDNFPEACAICLDTPVKGEVIRHLPCLHKFHKDCIDPWLHRKTSCPVCKSSIT